MKDHTQKFFKYAALYMSSSADTLTAFKMAKRRIKHKVLLRHIEKMLEALSSGLAFSEASKILKDKKCIDGVSWSMLSSADKAGSLRQSCEQVSRYLAAAAKVKKSLVSALAYPIGVVFMAGSMIYFLISFIFPKITPLLSSLHAPIPPTTMFLMFLSGILRHYFLHIIIAAAGLIFLFVYMHKNSPVFKQGFQATLFKVPIIKRILFAKESHALALSCGVLMHGGKSLTESLIISHNSSSNLVMRNFIMKAIMEIEAGRPMSDVFAGGSTKADSFQKMFQGEWLDLISVGETAGTLPRSFAEIAECYEGRLKEDLELIARWAEPLALFLSAAVILIVAMSVIQPMYAILQYVHS